MPKTFVITGSSRGIGLELTRLALEAGHIVHALARNPMGSTGLISLTREHEGRCFVGAVDVTVPEQVNTWVREFGDRTVDVLVNCAGILLDGEATLDALDLEKVTESFLTNTLGPIRMTQSLLTSLRRSSQPMVVQISSIMGSIEDASGGRYYGYRISKAALNMFAKNLSVDHPELLSLILHPGWVQTEMGGPKATLSAVDSARGLLQVITNAKISQSGHFYDYTGKELPW